MFWADIGPACKIYLQQWTLLLPVTVEAIEWIKSWLKRLIVNCLVNFTLLRYRCLTVAHILTHSVHLLGFRAKIGFKHKCQVRACDIGFKRLQIKARLQLWVAGRLHFDQGCGSGYFVNRFRFNTYHFHFRTYHFCFQQNLDFIRAWTLSHLWTCWQAWLSKPTAYDLQGHITS